MNPNETTYSGHEALQISVVITRILVKAEKLFGNRYTKISIQIEADEPYLIGHEDLPYGADCEHKLCKVTELFNGL